MDYVIFRLPSPLPSTTLLPPPPPLSSPLHPSPFRSSSPRYGHVFLWDSGSSVGEIIGHSKTINAIDYRPTRPFRVVTAGEDKAIAWFEGPPFRFKSSNTVCLLEIKYRNMCLDLRKPTVFSIFRLSTLGTV